MTGRETNLKDFSEQARRLDPKQRVTRLAPSPTGALHLGNARTFLINWALARKQNWHIVLRIEDLDTPRTKPGAAAQAIEDLAWLGMDWDDGPFYQQADLTPYRYALDQLIDAHKAFACDCTRKKIQDALSAPHETDHELRYPGTCRTRHLDLTQGDTAAYCWRFLVEPGSVNFDDQLAGPQRVDVSQETGDFVIWTKAGLPAYQLAVVVDDARQGVTDVVRGDDLIGSAARQLLLYEALGVRVPPRWWHLPLVVGEDGRRLAKRHGDTRVSWYREQGVDAKRIIGLIASMTGVCDEPEPMDARTFMDRLDVPRLQSISKQTTVFTPEMHQWLLA